MGIHLIPPRKKAISAGQPTVGAEGGTRPEGGRLPMSHGSQSPLFFVQPAAARFLRLRAAARLRSADVDRDLLRENTGKLKKKNVKVDVLLCCRWRKICLQLIRVAINSFFSKFGWVPASADAPCLLLAPLTGLRIRKHIGRL